MDWARRLARSEGIVTGISGGSTLAVAMRVAETAPEGSVILAMLPDTGERYMTTPLFQDIPEDMDAEEKAISASTPGFQLG
jgi:cysteine synthase A